MGQTRSKFPPLTHRGSRAPPLADCHQSTAPSPSSLWWTGLFFSLLGQAPAQASPRPPRRPSWSAGGRPHFAPWWWTPVDVIAGHRVGSLPPIRLGRAVFGGADDDFPPSTLLTYKERISPLCVHRFP